MCNAIIADINIPSIPSGINGISLNNSNINFTEEKNINAPKIKA